MIPKKGDGAERSVLRREHDDVEELTNLDDVPDIELPKAVNVDSALGSLSDLVDVCLDPLEGVDRAYNRKVRTSAIRVYLLMQSLS